MGNVITSDERHNEESERRKIAAVTVLRATDRDVLGKDRSEFDDRDENIQW